MASYDPVVKNNASGAIFYAALLDQATPGSFKASPTLAAGDFKVSIDGGAFNNLGTLPSVAPAAGTSVKFTLSQAETNGDNLVIACIDQTAPKEWCDAFILIQTAAANFDSLNTTLGAAGAGLTAIPFTNVWSVATRTLTASLDPSAATIAAAVWDLDATGHQTQGTFGQAIGDPVADTNTIFKATVTDATGVTVGADTAAMITTIGVAGAGLTAVKLTTSSIPVGAFVNDSITAAALAADAGTEIGTAVWATATRVLTANTNLNDPSAATIAAAVWDLDATAHQTLGTFGQAIGDPVADANTIFKAVVTDATAATVGLDTAAITTTLGAAGAGLTAIPFTNVWSVAARTLTASLDPTAATIAAAVWDLDATAHQTQGTFGQAIGDPVADTGTIFKATVTDATGVTVGADTAAIITAVAGVQSDTDNIQTRIPAALVGGRIDANLGTVDTNSRLGYTVPAIGRGTAAAGGSSTSIPTSAFSPAGASLDQFAGRVVLFDAATTTAALRGCARAISSSSNAATPTFTVTALPGTPVAGDTFSVV